MAVKGLKVKALIAFDKLGKLIHPNERGLLRSPAALTESALKSLLLMGSWFAKASAILYQIRVFLVKR